MGVNGSYPLILSPLLINTAELNIMFIIKNSVTVFSISLFNLIGIKLTSLMIKGYSFLTPNQTRIPQ